MLFISLEPRTLSLSLSLSGGKIAFSLLPSTLSNICLCKQMLDGYYKTIHVVSAPRPWRCIFKEGEKELYFVESVRLYVGPYLYLHWNSTSIHNTPIQVDCIVCWVWMQKTPVTTEKQQVKSNGKLTAASIITSTKHITVNLMPKSYFKYSVRCG